MEEAKKTSLSQRVAKIIGVKGDLKTAAMPMINYSSANIATSGAGYVISLYFSKFLTGTVHLDQKTQVSLILLVVPFWDAIIDPILGIIIDRTRSKHGRHRPYILAGLPIFCLSFVMLWNAFGIPENRQSMWATAYYILAYILFKTGYSIIDVAHTSMLPELATSYDLRTQYNSVGYIFNSFGMFPSFIFFSVVMTLTGFSKFTSDFKKPMLFIAITLSVAYALCLFQTYRKTREKPSLDMKVENVDLKYLFSEYKNVFRNRSFREYFFISMAYNISYGFYTASLAYYIDDLAHLFAFYSIFTVIAGVFEASAFPLNYALTMKHGKKKCGFVTTPLMLAGFAVCLFMQPSTGSGTGHIISIVMLMLTGVLFPFGKSGIGYACSNILPDITDVDELITGKRREGVIVTCNSLVKQAMSGVINGLAMFIMGSFGLVTGEVVEDWEKANPDMFYPQTETALWGVRLCVAVIPIIFAVVSLFLLKKFRMGKKEHEVIRAAIATKRRYGSVALTDEEIKIIEYISGQKLENTWLGSGMRKKNRHALDKDEEGGYAILAVIEAEEEAAKAAEKAKAEKEAERSKRIKEIETVERIDITQKEPKAPPKGWKTSLKRFFFYLIQWTWGLPVNIVGWIAFKICTKVKGYRYQNFGYAKIVYMPWNQGGLSMGLFIFMRDNHPSKKWTYDTRIHEYGHTWQCLLLGPLYYIVIALPSVIWCNCFRKYREKNNVPYSKVYCESWANKWGQKFTGMKQINPNK